MLHPSYSELMAVVNSEVEDANSQSYRAVIQLLRLLPQELKRLLMQEQ